MTLPKALYKPDLTNPTILAVTAPGTYTLAAGTDVRVQLPAAPLNGRVWIQGGRRVHVGWGPTAAEHGGEIRVTTPGTSCLILEGQEEEVWVEGVACLKFDGGGTPAAGDAIKVQSTTPGTPNVYLLNCFGDGLGASMVNAFTAIGKLTVDGLTFRTFDDGLAPEPAVGSWTSWALTRVSGHYGTGFARTGGQLLGLRPTCAAAAVPATLFDTWLVDDAAPTADISPLISPSTGACAGTLDPAGNVIFASATGVDGVVWKGTPPDGDWVPAADTGASYVQPGYESGAGLPVVSTARLLYHPNFVCPLTAPTTRNVGASGGTINLNAGEHSIITLNSGTAEVAGFVHVNGVPGSGNRVQIIGGRIRNVTEDATSNSHCLKLTDLAIAYLEGVKFDKADKAGDGIAVSATTQAFGRLYVQNCLGVGFNWRDTANGHAFTQHGDFLQVQHQAEAVFMDRVTFYTWSHGYLTNSALGNEFAQGGAILRGAVFRRVNGHAYDTALNPISNPDTTHPLFYFQDDCTKDPISYWLDQVYGIDEQASGPSTIADMVSPSAAFGTPFCGANYDTINQVVSWPVSARIKGKITYGLPPDGDYVPSSFTGLNYVSPGYDGVSICAIQRGVIALSVDHVPTVLELMEAAALSRGRPIPDPDDPAFASNFPHGDFDVALDGAWMDYPDLPALLPGNPPPAWITPAAVGTTVAIGGQVGQLATIPFGVVLRQDRYDPRTRSVIVKSISNIVGGSAVLGTASVDFTPSQQSPCSFSYTLEDSRGFTSSATCTLTDIALSATVGGLIASTLPAATAALAGTVTPPAGTAGLIASVLPAVTVSLSGTVGATPIGGLIASVLPAVTVSLSGIVNPPPPPPGTPVSLTWYGVGWQSTSLGNLTVPGTRQIAVRFRARNTGVIQSIRFYLKIDNAGGYSSGTGGIVRVRIFRNDPVTNRLTTQIGTSQATHTVSGQNAGQLMTFNTSVPVIAGELYHSLWDNIDANAGSNYYSLNFLSLSFTSIPKNPQISDLDDWTAYRSGSTGSWTDRRDRSTFIHAVTYTDGFQQGSGYMEVWLSGNAAHHNGQITNTQWSRQIFIPFATFTAQAFALRYGLSSGSGALTARIEDGSGALIENVTFGASESPAGGGSISHRWLQKSLAANRTFIAGNTYRVRLSTSSGTVYVAYPLRDGSHGYGYPRGNNVTINGRAEFSTNSGSSWTGWTAWNQTNRDEADLQFFFLKA